MTRRSKFKRLAEGSSVNDIRLSYNGEKFKFNLYEELSINPDKINSELQDQPSHYGFLLLLQAKLLTVKEDKERESDKVYGRMYHKFCEKTNPKTNRPYADKSAQQLAIASDDYNDARKKAIKAKEDYNIINAAVRAFEQRASLIQSIAANMRREN